MEASSYLLRGLLLRTPTLILFLAGVLFAISFWKRHPKASLLTLLGLCIWQLESFTFMFVYYKLPDWLRENGWSYESMDKVYLTLNLVQDVVYSMMLILLVAAAYSQRNHHLSTNT